VTSPAPSRHGCGWRDSVPWRHPGPWHDPALALWLAVVVLAPVQAVVLGGAVRTLTAGLPALVATLVVWAGDRAGAGRDDRVGHRWLTWLAAAQVTLAAWASTAFITAVPGALLAGDTFYDVKVRVWTPLGAHNTIGGLLLVGVVATAVLAQDDRRWWTGTVLTAAGVVASLSRGAALVLLVVGVASWLVGTRRSVAGAVTIAGAVSLLAVSLLAVAWPSDPDSARVASESVVGESVTDRLHLIERGVGLLVERPLLGVGLGSFGDRTGDVPFPSHHAHNSVAHAGAEGGVPYALIVVTLTLLLLVRAWRLRPGWRREVTLVGGSALVLHGQIDVLLGLVGHDALLAVLLVLARAAPATAAPVVAE
jgi:hypothetical protein